MNDKKIVAVDSQKLNALQMCMRRYQYTFGKSFEALETPIQFDRGTLIHHALEFYYKARQVKHLWNSNNLTHADIIEQGVQNIREKSVDMQLDIQDVEEVVRVFTEYCQHYQSDGWDSITFVEETASKKLYEDENHIFMYEGKVDLGISLSNMPLVIVDHKSFSRKSYTSDMSNQFKGYCWLFNIQNVIVNKIGFYSQNTKVPVNERYYREVLSYTKERLDEWERNAIFWIRQGLAYIENDLYPMNETSCDKYSGCSFRSVCQQNPGEDRETKLNEFFQIRERGWDIGSHLE